MLKISYAIFLLLCSVRLAEGGPTILWEEVCDNCVTYHPQHWQEDDFPAVTLIQLEN